MYKLLYLFLLVCLCNNSIAQDLKIDSLSSQKSKDTSSLVLIKPAKKAKNPRIAGLLSTFVPGAGQMYNGRWWKVPIVYGGGYLFYWGITTNQRGKDFYHGLLVLHDQNSSEESFDAYISGFKNKSKVTDKNSEVIKSYSEANVRTYYDDYSSTLQNLYIFSVVFYGLNILDAVVDAHSKTFDVRDDLALKIKPGIINSTGTFGGIGPSIGLQFSLK